MLEKRWNLEEEEGRAVALCSGGGCARRRGSQGERKQSLKREAGLWIVERGGGRRSEGHARVG